MTKLSLECKKKEENIMKLRKLVIVMISSLVFLFGVTVAAWAGGAGGNSEGCVVNNPGGGAIALRGTMAGVYTQLPDPYFDVKLRLERGGKFAFFQITLNQNIFGMSTNEIVCEILNPQELNLEPESVPRVEKLVDDILKAFFPYDNFNHNNTRLVLTRNSFSLTDMPSGAPIPYTEDNRWASIGDLTIYVLKLAK
jgi:hypothetical protein